MAFVRHGSISQDNWIDYIFTRSHTIASWLTSDCSKARAYIWYTQELEEADEIEIEWFQRTQRLRWFIKCISLRKKLQRSEVSATTVRNECDLLGEPFGDTYLVIRSNRYSVSDLIGILSMSLERREEFSSTPRCLPVDPYTNEKWDVPIMYHIQGWLRKQSISLRSIPLSVCICLQTPYVDTIGFTQNSKPYFLREYLEAKTRYNYFKETPMTQSSIVQELQRICENLEIPLVNIDWSFLLHTNVDTLQSQWMPLILRWNHPNDEWESGIPTLDYRMIDWKQRIRNQCKMSCCWIQRSQGKVFRRRRNKRLGRNME